MVKSKGRLLSELVESPKNEDYADVNALPNTGNKVGDQAFVEATDRLYIWNGSGWYNIALVNTTPTWDSYGQPSGSYVLDPDSPQDATIITLAASDPEGIPISYNYVTGGSMDSIATISQDSSVFTITPKTSSQAPEGGTGSITFRATDGINILPQVSSFTLNFATLIENSRYTTLLATAVDTSDNNNITDSSTNNHSITVNGDAHAGTFSPYRWNGASQYYDGSSYQVYGGWSDITGLSNVTIECWIYKTSHTNSYHSIMATRASGSNSAGFDMRFPQNSGVLTVYYTGGAGVTSTTNMNLNTWYHVMFVRDGSTGTLYIDGVQEDQDTAWGDRPGLGNLYVGTYARGNVLLDGCINGYISDLRISNISRTAEVPEAPISVDSNTLFHVAGKHGPYDTSSSYYSPSFTGLSGANLTKSTYGPYEAPISGYTTTDHGGSINFDGTGDYLTIPDHSSLNFASNDWTIECWIYPRTNVGDCGIWHQSASGTDWYSIYLDGAFNLKFVFYNASNGVEWAGTAASNTAPQNTWTHVALVRQFGTGVYLYANGKLVASDTLDASVTMLDKTYNHVIGYERFVGSGNAFDGLISDFKMDIGTAHYTGEFTPPTAPLSSSGADMHIKGTAASIIDKSQGANLNLFGNTTGSTTQVKFAGSKSMYFDGTGDYIRFNTVSLPDDFTLEYWLKLSTYSDDAGIFGYTGTTNSQHRINHNGTFGKIMLYVNAYVHQTTNCFTQSEAENWMHVSYSRQNGNLKLYVNGIQKDSVTSNITLDVDIVGAGGYNNGSDFLDGYIQDFRITNGLARYTTNFTPPAEPLEG